MSGDTTPYENLITSEHQDKPKFKAMIVAVSQAWADMIDENSRIAALYDLDLAVGQQLDYIGHWVGVNRYLTVPIPASEVYFAFDTLGLGFDEGVWTEVGFTGLDLVSLPDDYYRLLLRAIILNNRWDCDKPDAYALAAIIFAPQGFRLFIQDHSNLTMGIGLLGAGPPPALTWAMLTGGLLRLKPIGIRITEYVAQSEPGPIFAFDINNSYFSGFDLGAWGKVALL